MALVTNNIINNGITLNKAVVHSNDILPAGKVVPGRALASISYITIHNTGLDDVPANNFHRSQKNQNVSSNPREASWHLTVDDREIWQSVRLNWETWHAGNSTGNKNSISIECTQWTNKDKQYDVWMNAAALTAMLLKQYGLGVDRVRKHQDWSGKYCPSYLLDKKYGYDWNWFMARVKEFYNNGSSNGGGGSTTPTGDKRVVGEITILVDSLNVRKDASFDAPVVKTLSKGQKVQVMAIKNGLYKIREGQWCSAGSKYVSFREITQDVYEVKVNDYLNVRSGRGVEHKEVGRLYPGDRIAIWSIANASDGAPWGSFRYSFEPDVVGFVNMGYLRKI